jgi:hypothetical protein
MNFVHEFRLLSAQLKQAWLSLRLHEISLERKDKHFF